MEFFVQYVPTQMQHPKAIPPADMIGNYQYRMIRHINVSNNFHLIEIPSDIQFVINLEEIIDEEIVFCFNHMVMLFSYNLNSKSTKNTN